MRGYTPVVRAKKNDLGAITALSPSARARIFPLVEAPVLVSGGTLTTQSADAAIAASKMLGEVRFLFDPLGIEAPARQLLAFRTLVDAKSNFVPVFGLGRKAIPEQALAALVADTNGKFAVRLEAVDIEDPENTWDDLSRLITTLDTSASDALLLLDFGQIQGKDVDQLKELILDFLTFQPKQLSACEMVLIGSSALNTVSSVPVDGELDIVRRELALWSRVSFDLAGSRSIGFGDYGIVDPSFAFAGGPSGNANAKIRYTRHGRIKYFRGHGLYKPNRFYQYHDLANRVASSSVYLGTEFSFGDKRIADCASRISGPGNLATWVQVDMNHHIEYTARQIANLEAQVALLSKEAEISELIAND